MENFKQDETQNILISTDVLSEGFNIQEADWVINYDIPWNPVRIIQRIGRVDRITNEKMVYVANFIPDRSIELLETFLTKVKTKIKNIMLAVGTEYCILTLDEQMDIIKNKKDSVKEITEKLDKIANLATDPGNK